jgi:hypothetical protein
MRVRAIMSYLVWPGTKAGKAWKSGRHVMREEGKRERGKENITWYFLPRQLMVCSFYWHSETGIVCVCGRCKMGETGALSFCIWACLLWNCEVWHSRKGVEMERAMFIFCLYCRDVASPLRRVQVQRTQCSTYTIE